MNKDIPTLFSRIINGDRVSLGQAMTLVESDRQHDRVKAVELLEICGRHLAHQVNSTRIAISGAPGVGKSTFIEAIGLKAISEGQKVGVITIDPSSHISHGSILGDKSRMPRLSVDPSAFVRSSPAGHVLGGVSRRSFEMMTLLEAAGYEIILVETVGVGQSEHIAWQLTDGFVLVIAPGGGDELQGIKRGITELADIVVVNKADGSLRDQAILTKSHYQNAIHYLPPLRHEWEPTVLMCSALNGDGIDEFWRNLRLYIDTQSKLRLREKERNRQNQFWITWSLGIAAHQLIMEHPAVRQKLSESINQFQNHLVSVFKAELEIENAMKELIVQSKSGNE